MRYCTGLPWSCNRIGPGVHESPPIPARVLSTGILTLVYFSVKGDYLDRLLPVGAERVVDCSAIADRSDIVVTMLPTSASVEEVLLGDAGVVARLRAGGMIMDMSTVDPVLTDRVAAADFLKGRRSRRHRSNCRYGGTEYELFAGRRTTRPKAPPLCRNSRCK